MNRLLAAWALTLLAAGCQTQNPYAMFGPATVPSPGQQSPAPYYPANAAGGAATGTSASKSSVVTPLADASPAESERPSISAESHHIAATPKSTTAADPADREPIRIVENPEAIRSATRPAASRNGSTAPAQPATGMRGASSTVRDANVAPVTYVQPSTANSEAPGQWRARP